MSGNNSVISLILNPEISAAAGQRAAVTATTGASLNSTPTVCTPAAASSSQICPTCEGLDTGVVAGTAVATAVFGAIIATAVLLWLMKGHKKKRGSARPYSRGRGFRNLSLRSGLVLSRDVENGREKDAPSANLDLVLPQPLDDRTIGDEVSKVLSLIEDHIDSAYYHARPTKNAVMINDLASTLPAVTRTIKSPQVAGILDDPRTRFNTMQAIIAAELLGSINFQGETERTLLPQIVTSFFRTVSAGLLDDHRSRLSLSRWRTSTALLLGNQLNDRDQTHFARVSQTLVESLDVALLPFAENEVNEARKRHLLELCKEVEKLGLLLLAQPADWIFDWTHLPVSNEPGDRRQDRKPVRQSMVVFPGLIRLTDNSARKLDRPRRVLDAVAKG